MSESITGVYLSGLDVHGSVTISGVTVNGASTQQIAAAILRASTHRQEIDRASIATYREIYAEVASYVDELRPRTQTFCEDDAVVADMLGFMESYTVTLRQGDQTNWSELIESLTTTAMLERLYGQQLQLAFVRRRAQAGEAWSTPVDLHIQRSTLAAQQADGGHFRKSETCIREAINICGEKFGPGHFQAVILENELGLLHRDRGQYALAARQFRINMSHLSEYHSSEKLQISACYSNWAIVLRENRRHILALYFFWAAITFEEVASSVRDVTKQSYRQQWRYLTAYLGLKLFLGLGYVLLLNVFISSLVGWFFSVVIGVMAYKILINFADCLFNMLVSVWAMGVSTGLSWPPLKPSPILQWIEKRFYLLQARLG